jgi:hypothetical protein
MLVSYAGFFQPEIPAPSRSWFRPVRRAVWALASLVLLVTASWWYFHPAPSYEVERLDGSPQLGSKPLAAKGRLQAGEWLQTGSASRARIYIGELGDVEIEENTQIQLIAARPIEHRLNLQRGVLHARIWAPPGSFFVDTPFAQAVDLGCSYTLSVGDDGAGELRVTSGWVAFRDAGRESFVPAGARCVTHPGLGPGTPFRGDAAPRFKDALESVDLGHPARDDALAVILSESRKEDAITLWHLLARTGGNTRISIYDRLAQLVPPPAGVTRTGCLALDPQMLDLWWNALGLGDTSWYRLWERPWQGGK